MDAVTGTDAQRRRNLLDPDAPPRARRTLRTGPPQYHHWYTSDGAQLLLARYQGGDKGPVILVHGLGVSSHIFTLDTIDTNMVEYLYEQGYDVWTLDYRSSSDLPSATAPADADLIGRIDFPEAVSEVLRLTGTEDVQMVVHCFGATVFFISMLSGALHHVRSAVASQAMPYVDGAPALRVKANLRLARLLQAVGIDTLDAYTDTDTPWRGRLWDTALRLYPLPDDERCGNPICRRVSFMYSLLYEHSQLADATHDNLQELFGVCNISASAHVLKMVQAGHAVDKNGNDVYMSHPERLAIPLRLVHGAENACFSPTSSARTLEWLQEHNDPALYSRFEIPRYGHLDCIFGERAATDVFPLILEHLEVTA